MRNASCSSSAAMKLPAAWRLHLQPHDVDQASAREEGNHQTLRATANTPTTVTWPLRQCFLFVSIRQRVGHSRIIEDWLLIVLRFEYEYLECDSRQEKILIQKRRVFPSLICSIPSLRQICSVPPLFKNQSQHRTCTTASSTPPQEDRKIPCH